MKRHLAFLLGVFAAHACSGSDPSTPHAADAGEVACGGGALGFSQTEAEVNAALDLLLADLSLAAPDAYFREAIDGTRRDVTVAGLEAPLAVAHDVDPREAAVAWLAAAAPGAFTAGEWSANPLEQAVDPSSIGIGDAWISSMIRTRVAEVALPSTYPARWLEGIGLQLVIDKADSGWRLRWVTVTPSHVLATQQDAQLLAACIPGVPGPEAALRATSYHGLELDGCAPVREYDYTPSDGDTARWVPGVGFAVGPIVAGRASWRAFSQVELTIDPSHYWPTVTSADCYCRGAAGFTLRVDAVTGVVLRATPGVACTVC